MSQHKNNHFRYVPALDGLRGLAILLVLFLHFTIMVPNNSLEYALVNISSLGTHGVDLFFVLSGFLVTRILLEAKGRGHFFRNFYARRALRIFPLYYFLIMISFLVIPQIVQAVPEMSNKFESFDSDGSQWAWYVFFASNFLAAIEQRFTHDILGVSWSLAIEEHFYLIWPWFVSALRTKVLKRLLIAVILMALMLRIVCWQSGWTPLQIYVVTFTRMDTIAFGALLAVQLYEHTAEISTLERRRAFFGLMGGFLFVAAAFSAGWFNVKTVYLNTFMYSAVAGFFYLLVRATLFFQQSWLVKRLFANRVMIAIGRYSYALYLFHIAVRALIRNLWFGETQFEIWFGNALIGQGMFYLVSFSVTFVLAWLSWHLVEKHFLSLKRFFA